MPSTTFEEEDFLPAIAEDDVAFANFGTYIERMHLHAAELRNAVGVPLFRRLPISGPLFLVAVTALLVAPLPSWAVVSALIIAIGSGLIAATKIYMHFWGAAGALTFYEADIAEMTADLEQMKNLRTAAAAAAAAAGATAGAGAGA